MYEKVVNQLCEVLTGPPLPRGLYERLSHKRDQGAPEAQTSYADASLDDRLSRDKRIIVFDKSLDDLFDKHVFRNLPRPYAITRTDLEEVALSQLGGVALGDTFTETYERFVQHLLLRIPVDGRDSQRFDLGCWTKRKEVDSADTELLWNPPDKAFGVFLQFKSDAETTDHRTQPLQAYGTLYGYASTAAMEKAESEFRRLIPSIIQSLENVHFSSPSPGVLARMCRPASLLTGGFGKSFFSECVSSYFAAPEKKTDMTQRMHNAVHLLVAADAQQNHAIALSLCFSAIEALVCQKRDGITDELSRNVAALLQPESMERKAAIDGIRQLYSKRCKVLHGVAAIDEAPRHEAGEVSSSACSVSTREATGDAPHDRTRVLAAAVLGAVVDWKGCQRRADDTTKRKQFLEQLEDAVIQGAPMVLSKDFSRCLPGREA